MFHKSISRRQVVKQSSIVLSGFVCFIKSPPLLPSESLPSRNKPLNFSLNPWHDYLLIYCHLYMVLSNEKQVVHQKRIIPANYNRYQYRHIWVDSKCVVTECASHPTPSSYYQLCFGRFRNRSNIG